MIDCGFPIIRYTRDQSHRERGNSHGESYRDGIRELVEIRKSLLFEKNKQFDLEMVNQLALEQWNATESYHSDLTDELKGIADGAGVSIVDIVILNNYTDFRDIQVDDQGCSLAVVNRGEASIVGQTWDMHGSAKRYVCCLEYPAPESDHRTVAFSIVGCVGMMGFTTRGTVMGVNNINTDEAHASVMWPVTVRAVLSGKDQSEMVRILKDSPKTSGHNYLLADRHAAEMWEVAPALNERVGQLGAGETGHLFHTNHCLGKQMVGRETAISQNSTTHIRFSLLEKKISQVTTFDEMFQLMNDHENYPKSICSNFQTDSQDPSITCGGAVGNLETGKVHMWRGDQQYDDNFVLHEFDMSM